MLLLREADRAIGLIRRVAACFTDHRDADQVIHAPPTLIGQRIVAIALGYEDVNDHDTLRRDPVLALFSDRLQPKREVCAPLAGKSTVNRLEHAPREGGDRYHKIGHDPQALEGVFTDVFLDAYGTPPEEIVLDLDATDDPLHGQQEGRFFHGYYDCWCYLPLYVFCGRHLLAAKLRRSNIDAAAWAKDEVARLVAHIRRCWPKARIVLRADSGLAREELRRGARRTASIISSGSPATAGSSTSSRPSWRRPRPSTNKPASRRGGSRTSPIRPWTAGAAAGG